MSKVIFYVLVLSYFTATLVLAKWSVLGNFCWSCTRAHSHENCLKSGQKIKCKYNEMCLIEWRIENGLFLLTKGCKARDSCSTLEMQNPPQCHANQNPSVCRYCCDKNNCNQRLRLPLPDADTNTQCISDSDEKLVKTPPSLIPDEHCVIKIPEKCVSDGTVVFKTDKLPLLDRQYGMKFKNETLEAGKCLRHPIVETVAVFDDGDGFTFLTRVNYRYANGLPTGSKFTHVVGKEDVIKYMDDYNKQHIYI